MMAELNMPMGLGRSSRTRFDKQLVRSSGPLADPPAKASSIQFQVLDSATVLQPRVVYLIRHAESSWNKAQAKGDLAEMARTTDHSLSAEGCEQALRLHQDVLAARRLGDENAKALCAPDAFYVSPLTRAIQTAVIALGPMLVEGPVAEDGERGEIMLMGSAREKQNLGGLDSMSNKTGVEIIRHTGQELKHLLEGAAVPGPSIMSTFNSLRFDVQDAEEEWWCSHLQDDKEELKLRLKDFMSQLLYTPHRTAVVVGHSHFFREVFKQFLSKELREKPLGKDLVKKKMGNCAVIKLCLDPNRGLDDGPISSAELVLSSKMVSDGGGCMQCCNAQPAELEHEIDVREASRASRGLPAL